MTSMTIKKFIELLEKEEGQALELSRRLDLSQSRITNLILRRLEWLYYCITILDKNKIKNMGAVRFFNELKQGLGLYDSSQTVTIKELIRYLSVCINKVDSLIDKYSNNYRIGMYILRTLQAYKILLINTYEEHNRKLRYYASN